MKHLGKFNEALSRKERIQSDLERKRKELEDLEKSLEKGEDRPIKSLEDWTDEEKIEFFDTMYNFSLKHVQEREDSGYDDEDTDHWYFEEGIKVLYDPKNRSEFWKWYNSLV